MIALVFSNSRERAAFAALCESRGWASTECDGVQSALRLLRRNPPKVILVRHKLADGFSDDIISAGCANPPSTIKIIVVMAAGTTAAAEARQLALGADCVQRDPVRAEVLTEYLAKFRKAPRDPRADSRKHSNPLLSFAGGKVDSLKRTFERGAKSTALTPREVQLVELLVGTPDGFLTYDILYAEILGRRFRGDTSNMRVLLRKLAQSADSIGVALRHWVHVIPKTGYRYAQSDSGEVAATKRRRGNLLSAA